MQKLAVHKRAVPLNTRMPKKTYYDEYMWWAEGNRQSHPVFHEPGEGERQAMYFYLMYLAHSDLVDK